MIFFHHSMTEAPTPIRISHGPKIPKPFQSKSGSPFEVGTEPPTPIRISHRWKINPISSKSEIIGAQKLTVEPIFMVARCGFFLVQKRLFWKENPEPKKSKSGSDELMILLVIWAFFPSPVCICHWCISIGWLHQTLENVMAITSFCPIDISHSSIGIRVGLRKVARVVSIGIVTSHNLQEKRSWWLFLCVSWRFPRNEKPIIALALLMSTGSLCQKISLKVEEARKRIYFLFHSPAFYSYINDFLL